MSKQFLNKQEDCVRESVNGLLWQNSSTLTRLPNTDAIVAKHIDTSKVAIICGGGSGHEPAHAGFVYDGCLDGATCGGVFASPSHAAVLATIKHFKDCKKGILVLIKNYQGDVINFNYAAELAKAQCGLNVQCVTFGDDVTFSYEGDARRGLAGTVLLYKILGQIAKNNRNDDNFTATELAAKAQELAKNFMSYGVALESCTLPGKHKPNVELKETEMEFGLGIHGEAGNQRLTSIISAHEIVEKMMQKVVPNTIENKNAQVVLALNNLGTVTELEMGILVNSIMNKVAALRQSSSSLKFVRLIVGRFMTSLNMNGVSLTTLHSSSLNEKEWNEVILPALDARCPSSVQFSCVDIENVKELDKIHDSSKQHQLHVKNEIQESSPEGGIFRAKLEAIFHSISGAADTFDELDALTGDGDMGMGINRGMCASLAILGTLNFSEKTREAFAELGSVIADAHAGSSGPLIGALVAVGGSKLSDKASENIGTGTPFNQNFLDGLAAGVDAIQKIGGAEIGDRTMVDVLAPLRDVIRSGEISASKQKTAKEALEALIKIAKTKAEEVQKLVAKKGRSRYAEDRCIGKPDPGCELIVFVLEKIFEICA